MAQEYERRVIAVLVASKGVPTFHESATTVRIDDEAAGEFVLVEQERGDKQTIAIDPEEWPTLRAAIDDLIGECRA